MDDCLANMPAADDDTLLLPVSRRDRFSLTGANSGRGINAVSPVRRAAKRKTLDVIRVILVKVDRCQGAVCFGVQI